jgi:hypothetical protein
MVDGDVKAAIAARAHIPAAELTALSAASASSQAASGRPDRRGYVLTTSVLTNSGGDQLPVIGIDAQGPNVRGAASLARASASAFSEYLRSKAVAEGIPESNRLRVTLLGQPQTHIAVRGPRNAFVLGTALFVFALGCAGCLAVVRSARIWRRVAHDDAVDLEAALPDRRPATVGPVQEIRTVGLPADRPSTIDISPDAAARRRRAAS